MYPKSAAQKLNTASPCIVKSEALPRFPIYNRILCTVRTGRWLSNETAESATMTFKALQSYNDIIRIFRPFPMSIQDTHIHNLNHAPSIWWELLAVTANDSPPSRTCIEKVDIVNKWIFDSKCTRRCVYLSRYMCDALFRFGGRFYHSDYVLCICMRSDYLVCVDYRLHFDWWASHLHWTVCFANICQIQGGFTTIKIKCLLCCKIRVMILFFLDH